MNDSGDLSVAISQQPTGIATLNGALMGYGDELVTRVSFTAPMSEILASARAHRDALSQVSSAQTAPLVPDTQLAEGAAKVIAGNTPELEAGETRSA